MHFSVLRRAYPTGFGDASQPIGSLVFICKQELSHDHYSIRIYSSYRFLPSSVLLWRVPNLLCPSVLSTTWTWQVLFGTNRLFNQTLNHLAGIGRG